MLDPLKSGQELVKLAELKQQFTTSPAGAGCQKTPCPECGHWLSELDNVGAGVSCFEVTTLYYCHACGFYEIGETYWTSDY